MANKNNLFNTKEYLELSNALITNADVLSGKLSSIKTKGESLKRIYESIFDKPQEELEVLLATNIHLANLHEKLKQEMSLYANEVNKLKENIEKVSEEYKISEEDAKKAIILAREKTELLEKQIKAQQKIKDDADEILKLRREYLTAFLNGDDDEKDRISKEIDKANKNLKNSKSILNNINIELQKVDKKISNIPIAETFVEEMKDANTTVGKLNNSLNTTEDLEENIINLQKLSNEETAKGTALIEQQNKAYTKIANAAKVLWGIVKEGGNKWIEIDDKVSKVGRSIGLATNQIRGYQKNILANYGDMAAKLGMTTDEMIKFQESYTKNTGRAIILTNEQVSTLGAMSKLVGEVATNDMVKNMDDFGASTQTATSYLAINHARARTMGLDAQKASEAFASNVKLASKYTFREGVNGISKMTLLSQKLKFNMDSIANAAEKFETVEDAIGTAANLQMLGGIYSAQFGNPLEAMNMAMLDMEGFTQKIVDTFSGKATFNRETGQVEMSAIDKRLMREAAKQMGISYDEAWNMASQQAKIGDVERQINKTQNFSEEDKSWITSNSQYNAETKQHQITYFGADGEQKTVDVRDLTSEQLKQVKAQAISDKAIQGDVHGIHSILKAYVQKEAGDTRSLQEIITGVKEAKAVAAANMVDGPMNMFKQTVSWLTSTLSYIGESMIAIAGLWGIGKSLFGETLSKKFNTVKHKTVNKVSNWFNGVPNPSSGGSGGPSGSGGGSGSGSGRFGSKMKNIGKSVWKGTKGLGRFLVKTKVGRVVTVGATALGALGLMSAADGSQVDKSKLGGREVEPINNENENTTSSVNQQSQELIELQKHTALLQAIANKQGVDVKTINENSTFNKTDIEDNSEQTTASNVLSDSMNTTLMTAQVGSSKIAAKGLKAVAGRSGLKMAANMGRMAKAANPLGWISLGSSVLKDISGVEEGSGVDKAWSTANAALDGAALGGMIGSVIPGLGTAVGTAVGAAVGGVVGIIDNYGEDIAKATKSVVDGVSGFLFGKDNMTEADKIQQSYEETKMGVVDITDPQLEQKAYMATCKIHDVVISMWHHMNGKQSNGLEEDNGLIGTPFKIIGSLFGSKNNTNNNKYNFEETLNPNTYYNSSNMLFDNILVKDSYYNSNSSVMSKPVVGTPTHIKKTVDFNSPSYKDNLLINNKLDLNVSGTIKLTTDNGKTTNLDIDKLLNNTEFVRKLTEVITNRLNKNSNGGRSEKNSVESINNSSSVKTRNQ